MISLSEARQLITSLVKPRASVVLPLASVHGRVLAEDVKADGFYPAGDRSQMDGYVVAAEAGPGRFRLQGEIPAGVVPVESLAEGGCFRIFTGALLPPGGGRVVMQEDVTVDGEEIVIPEFKETLFVRKKGSEAVPGQVVLPSGSVLGGTELAILAQAGAVLPSVYPAPSVRHVATGNELVDPSEIPAPGMIRDTNTSLLRGLAAGLGIARFQSSRVGDDLALLVKAADVPDDLVLLSGGASVGAYDYGARALRALGYEIHFDRVNLRPGKPLTFATRGSQVAFVLPGNPVSHFVCWHLAVKLALERLNGQAASWPVAWLPLEDTGGMLAPDPRETWWPAAVSVKDGPLVVSPRRWSTSGNTFSLAGINALIQVNQDSPAEGRALALMLGVPFS